MVILFYFKSASESFLNISHRNLDNGVKKNQCIYYYFLFSVIDKFVKLLGRFSFSMLFLMSFMDAKLLHFRSCRKLKAVVFILVKHLPLIKQNILKTMFFTFS